MDASVLLAAAGGLGINDVNVVGGRASDLSIFALFRRGRVRTDVRTPTWIGNGHELTPHNLAPAERGTAGAVATGAPHEGRVAGLVLMGTRCTS
jgi:hypothetical protein